MSNYKNLLNKLVIFQLVTLFLFYFGPLHYEKPGVSGFVAVVVSYFLLMLKMGAFVGEKYYFKGRSGPKRPVEFILLSAWVTICLVPITIYARVGGFLVSGELGDIYTSSLERRQSGDSIVEYIRMVFGFILFGLFPMIITYWGAMSRKLRVLSAFGVALNVYMSYLMGVNKFIFDCIIIFISQQYLIKGHLLLKTLRGWLIIVSVVIGFVLAAIFFTQGQLTREGSAAVSGVSPTLNAYSDYSISDGELFVFYSAMSTYLTQGYRAIDLSLHEPFLFTWGVGNSSFLSRQVDRLFGTNIQDYSYPARIEVYGWDRYTQWSSFYLWWASDLSYIGVGILMFSMGFFYSAIGNTLTKQGDVASIILMAYTIITLFYLSK